MVVAVPLLNVRESHGLHLSPVWLSSWGTFISPALAPPLYAKQVSGRTRRTAAVPHKGGDRGQDGGGGGGGTLRRKELELSVCLSLVFQQEALVFSPRHLSPSRRSR
uniref:Uncharacterized protein n=1 Tax=Knipowitschia caucasica TaxID=637954 RepID=A0AAV2ISE6_KNICA